LKTQEAAFKTRIANLKKTIITPETVKVPASIMAAAAALAKVSVKAEGKGGDATKSSTAKTDAKKDTKKKDCDPKTDETCKSQAAGLVASLAAVAIISTIASM